MTGPADFAKLVPGFDFLQGLMKGAGQALPSMNQWIAPTLDPVELEKRIEQLRTVQFWLEQNAKLLAASIQALEVQRMTLATLKTMNVPLDSMREAFKLTPQPPSPPPPSPPSPPPPAPAAATANEERERAAPPAAAAAKPALPGIDPMQWWGALTQQFTELASQALKDSSSDAAKAIAGQAFKTAVELPAKVMGAKASVKPAAKASAKSAAKSATKPPARAPAKGIRR
jgi:hypothetical protein